MIDAAIAYGAHPSALIPEAAAACRAETLEKVADGYAKLFPWTDLRAKPPPNLKISPIAAIPHKSRAYRMILDLSKGVVVGTTHHPSVNETTNTTQSPTTSMGELGNVLPRLIYAAGSAPDSLGPVLFAKFDIKDGYWRMRVPDNDEWHFAFVLPKLTPEEPTQIVVPSSLQMGWSESPAFFCAATETARDVAAARCALPPGSVSPHPLESNTIDPTELARARATHLPAPTTADARAAFSHLLEVYIDDFCALAQTTDERLLRHLSSSILTSIHEVFPPPHATGQHPDDDPISLKKLNQGDGVWATRKELLGWVFDGVTRCIELPETRATKLNSELHRMGRRNTAPRKDLEKLRGKLRHAAIAIPGGRGLLSPLDHALRNESLKWIPIKANHTLRDALRDFRALISLVGHTPTSFKQLIAAVPGYIGYCDASKLGAGGVWFPGSARTDLPPIVWRVAWPPDIQAALVSVSNPTGTISNSDLEMAGLLLHYLVLECLADLKHVHVAAWCDNTPTVSWANKLNSSKSRVAARLVRALALRIQANAASPLITVSIAGIHNTMADVASRAFGPTTPIPTTTPDDDFLHQFSSTFPLPQAASWHMYRLPNKLSSLVISELRTGPLNMGSWLRITRKGGSIGHIGATSPSRVEWTPRFNRKRKPSAPALSALLPSGSGQERLARDVESELAPFKSRFVPSARRVNWLDSPTRSTAATRNTSDPSNG
jgi:hypothetical protein